jgi:hypothetical protein
MLDMLPAAVVVPCRYRYNSDEELSVSTNVEWRHFLYRSMDGGYIPSVAAYTTKAVTEGG